MTVLDVTKRHCSRIRVIRICPQACASTTLYPFSLYMYSHHPIIFSGINFTCFILSYYYIYSLFLKRIIISLEVHLHEAEIDFHFTSYKRKAWTKQNLRCRANFKRVDKFTCLRLDDCIGGMRHFDSPIKWRSSCSIGDHLVLRHWGFSLSSVLSSIFS